MVTPASQSPKMSNKNSISQAQARLNRLFPYIGRPPTPDLHTPVPAEDEIAERHLVTTSNSGPGFISGDKVSHAQSTLPHESISGEEFGESHGRLNRNHIEQPPKKDGKDQPADNPPATTDRAGKYISFFPDGKVASTSHKSNITARSLTLVEIMVNAGTPKPLMDEFCLFAIMAKFPYKYMNDPENSVSQRFFAGNQFYNRKWSLFYLNPPKPIGGKPLILLPIREVRDFLDEISAAFDIDLVVPPFPFSIPFYADGTPQPSFLGVSRNRDEVSTLQQNIPYEVGNDEEGLSNASEDVKRDFTAWQLKFSQAQAAIHAKASRRGGINLPHMNLASHRDQFRRAQHYLRLSRQEDNISEQKAPLENKQNQVVKEAESADVFGGVDPKIDNEQVVLVSIDIESDERNPGRITELGVSTLDTLDLQGGPNADWAKHIVSRHFRIQGTEGIRNSKWCIGNPDSFEHGQTEWIKLADMDQAITECFQTRFAVGKMKQKAHSTSDEDKIHELGIKIYHDPDPKPHKHTQTTKVVMIGHDIRADINYLINAGSQIFKKYYDTQATRSKHIITNSKAESDLESKSKISDSSSCGMEIIDILDTALIDQGICQATQTRSLAKLCAEKDVTAWNLHNAGNDARYTLEAFIKLVISETRENTITDER